MFYNAYVSDVSARPAHLYWAIALRVVRLPLGLS